MTEDQDWCLPSGTTWSVIPVNEHRPGFDPVSHEIIVLELDQVQGPHAVPPSPQFDPVGIDGVYLGDRGWVSVRGIRARTSSREELSELRGINSFQAPAAEANLLIEQASDARLLAAALLDAAAIVEPEGFLHESSLEAREELDLSDDGIVGIDELVEAILIRAHVSDSDHTFWSRFIDLSLVLLGFEGRDSTIRMMLEDTPARAVPLQRAMEVPEEYFNAIQQTPDFYGRVAAIGRLMQNLQREFFRNALLESNPSAIERTTTIRRLKELGLPEKRYFDYEDY